MLAHQSQECKRLGPSYLDDVLVHKQQHGVKAARSVARIEVTRECHEGNTGVFRIRVVGQLERYLLCNKNRVLRKTLRHKPLLRHAMLL